jgi:uncharacterized damage-inducible protein DinB
LIRIILLAGALSVLAFGQSKTAWSDMAARQAQVVNNLKKSADKMPAESWDFKPSHDVMAYSAFLAHLADANYAFCSTVLGEKNPSPGVAKTMKGKEQISAALGEAFAYCQKAYDTLTNSNANDMVKLFGQEMTKAGALQLNTAHNFEHYGNLVTYLRIRGLVPPSSERR